MAYCSVKRHRGFNFYATTFSAEVYKVTGFGLDICGSTRVGLGPNQLPDLSPRSVAEV